MVGGRGQRNADHPSPSFWKNPEHEHGGAVLFPEICQPGRSVSGPFHLGEGKVQEAAGDLSGACLKLRGCERDNLCGNQGEAVPDSAKSLYPARLPFDRRIFKGRGGAVFPEGNVRYVRCGGFLCAEIPVSLSGTLLWKESDYSSG